MANFAYDVSHMPPAPNPEAGKIKGKLHPGISGPGNYTVDFVDSATGTTVATDQVHSADGDSVVVRCSHTASAVNPGPFRINLQVRINGGPPDLPVPVFLRK